MPAGERVNGSDNRCYRARRNASGLGHRSRPTRAPRVVRCGRRRAVGEPRDLDPASGRRRVPGPCALVPHGDPRDRRRCVDREPHARGRRPHRRRDRRTHDGHLPRTSRDPRVLPADPVQRDAEHRLGRVRALHHLGRDGRAARSLHRLGLAPAVGRLVRRGLHPHGRRRADRGRAAMDQALRRVDRLGARARTSRSTCWPPTT